MISRLKLASSVSLEEPTRNVISALEEPHFATTRARPAALAEMTFPAAATTDSGAASIRHEAVTSDSAPVGSISVMRMRCRAPGPASEIWFGSMRRDFDSAAAQAETASSATSEILTMRVHGIKTRLRPFRNGGGGGSRNEGTKIAVCEDALKTHKLLRRKSSLLVATDVPDVHVVPIGRV